MRVYATGYSGGARMASALACEIPDQIAAIAPVAGLRAGHAKTEDLTSPSSSTCAPEATVSVLAVHGTLDETNPFEGSNDPRWGYSVPAALDRWSKINDCTLESVDESVTETVMRVSHEDCSDGTAVQLYLVSEDGHTWPGSLVEPCSECGRQTDEIMASELMWDFFEAHPKKM